MIHPLLFTNPYLNTPTEDMRKMKIEINPDRKILVLSYLTETKLLLLFGNGFTQKATRVYVGS